MNFPSIYTKENIRIVHNLHYGWTGWTNEACFPASSDAVVKQCAPLWFDDGLQLESCKIQQNEIQCLFKAIPQVSPVFCCARVKGRLQHAFRKNSSPIDFSRKIGFRSLGDNTREIVQKYIAGQAVKSDYIDPRFKEWLEKFNSKFERVNIAEPEQPSHGCYWYALHIVIVVKDRRFPMTLSHTFEKVRFTAIYISNEISCELAEISVMPDHIHMALRGNINLSPQDIALSFLNGLAYAMGSNACWSEEAYVGSFSEYAVSRISRSIGTSPMGTRNRPDWACPSRAKM